MKRITIVGTGYVGLVTGTCFADLGHQVTCLDIDHEKIASLKAGNLPFFEPGLKEVFKRNVKASRLSFTSCYDEAVPGCDICFLALPTPPNEDNSCDMTFFFEAVKQLASAMDNSLIIVNKSTVPVGTAQNVCDIVTKALEARGVEIPFDVVSNPEFLREGAAIADCLHPERIIIGASNSKSVDIMRELYAPLLADENRFLVIDILSAEMAKYASNAMLATRLSFMNSLSLLCDKTGANINSVRKAMGMDSRIGPSYLLPGIGFGGSCLPKDLKALCALAHQLGISLPILESTLEVNANQQQAFFERITENYETLSGKTFAIWGLSFKPDTDDLREAPSLALIHRLIEAGASIRAYDPAAMPKAKILFNAHEEILFCKDEYDAAEGCDGIILVTEWKQFQFVDFEKIAPTLKRKIVLDGRNQFNHKEMQKRGFEYLCIGIPSSEIALHV